VIFFNPDTSRSYTYIGVKNTSIDFGHALQTVWKWKKGDVMAVYSANCIDYGPLMWEVLWATGVVSPANPAYSASELAFQLKNSESKAILTLPALLETAYEAAKMAGIPRDRILVVGDEKTQDAQHFSDFIESAKDIPRTERIVQGPSDLAYIPYSSGTTGLPKGVALTQQNIVVNCLQTDLARREELSWDGGKDGSGDSILAVLPFYHAYGLSGIVHHPIYAGLKVIVLPKFTLETCCEAVQVHKITCAYVVPPILIHLSKNPIVDKYDLSSIKSFVSAAAPLTKELVHAVYSRLKIPVTQAYGLTETSPALHIQV
jgi:4-coumarate--CoA ligase